MIVKNPTLLKQMHEMIHSCEWPAGCKLRGFPLELAHIRAKGMGGGFRMDTPENLVMLCREHHRMFDQSIGQGASARAEMLEAARSRPEWLVDALGDCDKRFRIESGKANRLDS